MTNITKCNGEDCEAKHTCYRFTTKTDECDFCFIKSPIVNNGCEYYINHNTLTPEIKANIEKGADLFVKNVFPIIKKLSKE